MNPSNFIERSMARQSSKGRIAKIILASATPDELEFANKIFGRTSPSFADFEFLYPILTRKSVGWNPKPLVAGSRNF
jgi:hypothetical protein